MTTPIRTAPSSAPLARLGVSAIWRRLATLVALGTAAAGLVFGCSTDDTALPTPGAGPAIGSVELRCAEGTTQSCATTLSIEGEKLSCYEGQQTCVGGAWGPCVDGTVVERPAPDPRVVAQLRAQDTGVPWELCRTASFGGGGASGVAGAAGAPSITLVFNNPCDFRCRIQYQPGTYPGTTTGGSIRGDRTKVLGHFDLPPTPPCTDGSDCQANTRCEEPTTDSCAHLTCLVGSALDPACDPCVTDICDTSDGDGKADCCTVAWDSSCVAMVKTVCDAFCADDICSHSPCDEGEGLVSGCDDPTGCVADICTADPSCCSSGAGNWDADCIAGVDTECGMFVTYPSCFDGLQNGDETGVDCGGSSCPACATCTDGLMNGAETGVDCGGACPTACPTCSDGLLNGTETGIDCGGTCPACPTCTDGLLNGPETGIDCGGTCPAACTDGQGCVGDGDCVSGDCSGGVCVCGDGLTNNGESGTDCGGSCPDCADGETCTVAGDCLSATCTSGECVCGDGALDNGETDVDCGGTCGATCLDGQTCAVAGDCDSGDCTGGLCLCGDGLLNNNETDVDCGGPCGATCTNGEGCDLDGDCTSGICFSGSCIACGDSVKNGLETDVDCGGADCGATCPDGYDCLANGDCANGSCASNLCRSCSDSIKNGTESDVDCGGSCGATCVIGDSCGASTDCQAPAVCTANVCTTPVSCFNGLKDGTETDVDCGGSCAADCAFRQGCSGSADCQSNSCVSNVCTRHLCEYAALGAGSVNSSVMFKVKGARLGTSNLTLTGSTSTLVNSFANVDIANGGTTWLSTPSTVSGNLASSGSLNLTDWSVSGTAYYTGTLVYSLGSVPNREQSNQVALPTIPNKDASFSCTDWNTQKWSSWGTPPLTSGTLTPGQYGNVTVDSSYELPFGNGDYYFQSLTVDTGRLKVPPAGSVANVYVCGSVAFKGATAQMTGVGAPASPLAGLRLRIYTKSSSSNAIDFGGYGPYFGLFMAPNGTVQTSYSAKIAGPVWANGVKSVTDWSSNGNTIDVNGGSWGYTGGAITEASCRSALSGYVAANTAAAPATSPLLRPAVEDDARVELAANDATPVEATPAAPAALARAEVAPVSPAPAPATTVPLLDPASYGPLADYVVTARAAPEPAWAPLPGTATPAWAVATQSYAAPAPIPGPINGAWCSYTFYSDGDLTIDSANLFNPSSGSAKVAARGNVYLINLSPRLDLLPDDPLIAGGFVIMKAGAQISGSVAAIGNPPTLPASWDYSGQAAGPVQLFNNTTSITKNPSSTLGYAVWAQPVVAPPTGKAVYIEGIVAGGVKTGALGNVVVAPGGTNPQGVTILDSTKPTLVTSTFDDAPTTSCPGTTSLSGPPYNLAAGTNAGNLGTDKSIVFQNPGLYTFQSLTTFAGAKFDFPLAATAANPVKIVVCGKVQLDGKTEIGTKPSSVLAVRWWVLDSGNPAFVMNSSVGATAAAGFFGVLSVPSGKAQFGQNNKLWGMVHAKEIHTTAINIVQSPPATEACNTNLCASVTCTAPECQTPGTCNPATGICSAPTNKANGTACTADANSCTNDICNAGACTHPNNTNACNDGNACTQTDTCSGGSCVGSNPKVCPAVGECQIIGTCNTTTGVCSAATNKAYGTACTDDGNSCTDDVCSSGSCTHPNDNTNTCSDGNACTSDVCNAGNCVGSAITCNDGKPCTDDSCDSLTGCKYVADNTNTCSDGNACTTDACVAGLCVPSLKDCNDGNPCTDDGCVAATGACTNTPDTSNPCSDGSACTDDACSAAGACVSTGIDCGDANPCTDDSCDTSTGCINDPDATNSCTDGDACTDDTCSAAGACVSTAITCNDANVCTDDTCNPATGCVYTNDDTNTCSDGSACTTELCAAGVCLATGILCDDANVCTDDSCDPATGCVYANDDTNTCDDGDACTTTACSTGSCVGSAITCDDGDTCTADSCDPATGCQTAEIPLCGPQCEFNPDHSACVPWADGEQDDACVGKPDLALDIPCLDAALHGRVPVCNHGMAPAPNGVKVHFFPYDPAAPALGNWGQDDAAGAVAALTCTSTDPILPGECVPVDCGAFPDDGAQYLVMVNPSADGVVGECYHQDNWSAFLSSRTDGACLADLTTTSFEETFDPAECEPGQGIRWQFFAWEAYVPDDAEVRFALRSCFDAASTDCSAWIELDADLPAMLPTFPTGTRNVMAANHDEDSDPVAAPNPEVRGRASCDFSDAFDPTRRCPVVLGDVLRKDDPYVQMRATLIPNSTFTDAPVLLNRYITHSCVDDE